MAERETFIPHFDRVWNIAVGTIGIDGTGAEPRLRVAFEISRGLERDANDARVQLYNLSEPSRRKLEGSEKGVTVRVQAGYRDTGAETLFFGTLRNAHTNREGPDLVTVLESGDGDRSAAGRVSRTWTKGTPIERLLRDLMRAAGLRGDLKKLKKALRFNGRERLERSFTAHGSTLEVLHHFCWACGLEYSIQNQEFQFLEIGQALEGVGPRMIKVIGDVEVDPKTKHVTFQRLMLPFLVPGGPFSLRDKLYRCQRIVHSGDSRGNDWISEIEGKPLS